MPPIIYPYIDKYGLVNIPASIYLYGFELVGGKLVNNICNNSVFIKVKRGIDFVTKSNGILHIWFHPNNLIDAQKYSRLVRILKYINKKQKETSIEIKTMKEIARYTLRKFETH